METTATLTSDRLSFACPSCHVPYSWSANLPSASENLFSVPCDGCGATFSVRNPSAVGSVRTPIVTAVPENSSSATTPSETDYSAQTQFTVIGVIAGVILGYPLSYYFQSAAVREKVSLGEYIRHFSEIVGSKELQSSIVVGFIVAIVVCGAVGFWLGRTRDQK